MPHHENVTVSGVITDVFAHRFVLETDQGKVLADLTPKGAERIRLRAGARVTVSGERKPSEIKVESFTPEGGEAVAIESGKLREEESDPGMAIGSAEAAGYVVLGSPRRKPKHFEVLGRKADGSLHELHVELDGHIRKAKDADPEKWADERAPST